MNIPTRDAVIAAAERFADHVWTPRARHVLHGPDVDGIVVHTPDEEHEADGYVLDERNVGVPYCWGGGDTLASFDEGLRRGAPAGNVARVYGVASRRAVGLDCSGLVTRAWGLARKQSTMTLAESCTPLASFRDLLPGDIVNKAREHVLLFVEWADDARKTMLVIEAARVRVERSHVGVGELVANGYVPMRDPRRDDD